MAELTDDDLLRLVQDERRAAMGFEQDQNLSSDREKALNYYKGEMPDVPAIQNRSKAVSTDVSDAIETILPDLVEIFTGGDDVATFRPIGEEDEESARQETDYINHVVLNENPGFMLFYTAIKDACLSKTGVFTWNWEEYEQEREERFEGKSAIELQQALAWSQQNNVEIEDVEADGEAYEGEEPGEFPQEPTYSYTLKYPPKGKACIDVVPPEDMAFARDTVRLCKTTYCAMRTRPRAQDLIADGYDPKLVATLPQYSPGSTGTNSGEEQARDTAYEHDEGDQTSQELRTVQIIRHIIRIVNDEGEPEYWSVVTGDDERVLLSKDRIEEVPFSAITPYPVTHRFIGRSVADLLMEIQKIKTALTRAMLDGVYFALNQRHEVAIGPGRANEFTIQQLMQNEPGLPVLSHDGNSVRALGSPGLGFEPTMALEYFSTVAEGRTGIVRNAQGLNPDTLHDTASGAAALMSMAQKRTRLIARIFAETGIKDMFLGVHALIRRHGTMADKVRLRGKWVDVDPSQWGERKDMTIEIGVGSGGREEAVRNGAELMALMEKIIAMQGGTKGPMVTLDNAYNAIQRYIEKGLGFRSADPFITDPKDAEQQEPEAPPPDPKMLELQQKMEIEQEKLRFEKVKAEQELMLDRERMQIEADLKREQMAAEMQLQREKMAYEARIQAAEAAMRGFSGGSGLSSPSGLDNVRMGGEIG